MEAARPGAAPVRARADVAPAPDPTGGRLAGWTPGRPGAARAGRVRRDDVRAQHVQREPGASRPVAACCVVAGAGAWPTAGSPSCSPACGSSAPATRSARWRSARSARSGSLSSSSCESSRPGAGRSRPRSTARSACTCGVGDLHDVHVRRFAADHGRSGARVPAAGDHVLILAIGNAACPGHAATNGTIKLGG